MSRVVFEGKLLGETQTVQFDFTSRLASGETLSTAAVTSSVYSGTDASPQGLVYASASISGAIVSQKIWAGTLGVVYALKCVVTTSASQTLALVGYVTVIPDLA